MKELAALIALCSIGCGEIHHAPVGGMHPDPGVDRSWIFASEGEFLYFNPDLLDRAECAVYLEWDGPLPVRPPIGLTAVRTTKGYGWHVWPDGERRFYVAKAEDCSGSTAHAAMNGGTYLGYYLGPDELRLMTTDARRWIWCDWTTCPDGTSGHCGCDGKADFRGDHWETRGNQ